MMRKTSRQGGQLRYYEITAEKLVNTERHAFLEKFTLSRLAKFLFPIMLLLKKTESAL
jgi:hypothetical protein